MSSQLNAAGVRVQHSRGHPLSVLTGGAGGVQSGQRRGGEEIQTILKAPQQTAALARLQEDQLCGNTVPGMLCKPHLGCVMHCGLCMHC